MRGHITKIRERVAAWEQGHPPRIAARVLAPDGSVLATVPLSADVADVQAARDAIVEAVLAEDWGDAIVAGVAFGPDLGGGAVGFTRPLDPAVACPIDAINAALGTSVDADAPAVETGAPTLEERWTC